MKFRYARILVYVLVALFITSLIYLYNRGNHSKSINRTADRADLMVLFNELSKMGTLPIDENGYREVSYSMVHDAGIGKGNHGIRLEIMENNGHPRFRTLDLLGYDIQNGKAIMAKFSDRNGMESMIELIDVDE